MTTTLHGLVTISELFAGFNLINTGVVNCLIMCQNTRKMHHSEAKYPKKFWRGAPPLQTPPPLGESIHYTLYLTSETNTFHTNWCPDKIWITVNHWIQVRSWIKVQLNCTNRSRASNTSQVIDLYIKIQGNFNFNCICVDILKPYMLPAISLL